MQWLRQTIKIHVDLQRLRAVGILYGFTVPLFPVKRFRVCRRARRASLFYSHCPSIRARSLAPVLEIYSQMGRSFASGGPGEARDPGLFVAGVPLTTEDGWSCGRPSVGRRYRRIVVTITVLAMRPRRRAVGAENKGSTAPRDGRCALGCSMGCHD